MTPKLSWKEGMALLPQHFQYHDAMLELRPHEGGAAFSSCDFGFLALEYDDALLASGQISLRRCRGIFPGGTAFDSAWLPAALCRPLPPGLGTSCESLAVHVVMPAPAPEIPLGEPSFMEIFRPLPDLMTGGNEQEIPLLVPRLSLRFESEGLDGFLSLAAGTLIRSPSGAPAWSGALPVLLDVHAWAPLEAKLQELSAESARRLEMLSRGRLAHDASGLRAWAEELCLGTATARLSHLRHLPEVHPARLFDVLLDFAAGLTSAHRRIMEFPAFDHQHPDASLGELFRLISAELGQERESRHDVKLMTRESPLLFVSSVDVAASSGRLLLAIRSELSPESAVTDFVKTAKAAPQGKLSAIVMSALPGLELRPATPPDFYLPDGHVFAEVVPDGALGEELRREGKLGIYAPAGLRLTEIELLQEAA